jgi:two-component system nitrate/nitrite response regulator NarP
MTKIFLADDHPMVRTALESLLRRRGHEIVGSATTGAEALSQIETADAEVIVLDVQMPGGSGIHVLGELRERGDKRPIVLLTAALADEALRRALSLGVQGILLKSSDPVVLIEALDEVSKGRTWIDTAVQDRVSALLSEAPKRPLTEREQYIVRLVQQGLKNREIAQRLNTTEGTVKAYLQALFDKLAVENRTELAMKADQILGPAEDAT